MNTKHSMKTALLFSLFAVVVVSLTAGTALATHKSWVLKNGAADCSFFDPGNAEHVQGSISNSLSVARTLICPVALSARWGSTASPIFAPMRGVPAMSAIVYTYKAADILFCNAAGVTDFGSMYFSGSAVAPSGVGPMKLVVASSSNWGGDLETNRMLVYKSLDFSCNIPAIHPQNGRTEVYGYKVKICQLQSDCSDGRLDHDDGVDSRERITYVQNSGFECSPAESWDVPHVTREFGGMRNTGTSRAGVICPITPPADDSYEHNRQTTNTKVYYKGGAADSNCVANQTCPECYLEWVDRNGGLSQSSVFAVEPFQGYVKQVSAGGGSDPNFMGTEVQSHMHCWLPTGVTLSGTTAVMSLTRISGGI